MTWSDGALGCRELQDKKRNMAQIIEQSNQAYEQRDAFQMEIAAIEQANRKEQDDFDEQMATLAHMLEVELQIPSVGVGYRSLSNDALICLLVMVLVCYIGIFGSEGEVVDEAKQVAAAVPFARRHSTGHARVEERRVAVWGRIHHW